MINLFRRKGMVKKMKTRILTAAILTPLLVLLLLFADSPVLTVAVIVISAMGLYEFYKATGLWEKRSLCIMGILAAVIVPLLVWIPQSFYHLILYAYMLALFLIMLIRHENVSLSHGALIVFSIIYIPYFLTNLLYIRQLPSFGKLYLWLPFVGAFLTDTGAYFTGVFLGKHKLCPEISPKKTVEGSVGGIVVCVGACMLFGLLVEKFGLCKVEYIPLAVLGFIMSVVSQVGDLSASIIKRKYGIKDYGTIFPGHGGILDRLDSVIMIAPAVYIFIVNFGIFK